MLKDAKVLISSARSRQQAVDCQKDRLNRVKIPLVAVTPAVNRRHQRIKLSQNKNLVRVSSKLNEAERRGLKPRIHLSVQVSFAILSR